MVRGNHFKADWTEEQEENGEEVDSEEQEDVAWSDQKESGVIYQCPASFSETCFWVFRLSSRMEDEKCAQVQRSFFPKICEARFEGT